MSLGFMGLDSDRLSLLFGDSASRFLERLNQSHPDILREPFFSFFEELRQTAVCASFCFEKNLDAPLGSIVSCAPKGHHAFFSACRLLDDAGRDEARRNKVPFWFDFQRLRMDPLLSSPDMPSSFDRFKSTSEGGGRWMEMEADFLSVGCGVMAAAARAEAREFSKDEFGAVKLNIRRAFLILGRRLNAFSLGEILHPVAVPAHSVSLPEWARKSIEISDKAMGGHPMFDHHVVLSFSGRPSFPESLESGIVVLGERDGQFHFVDSD